MRVLAVDPGLTRCGIGVVDGAPGRPLSMVAVGVLRTTSGTPLPQRLHELQVAMEEWFVRYEPDAVAIERMFARSDVSTIMGTAQASAVPMLAAARRGLPVALHTPSEVKAAVTGNGRADKAQVTTMITRILRLDTPPKPADAADALALAVCQVWRGGAQGRLDAAVAAQATRPARTPPSAARSARLARPAATAGTPGSQRRLTASGRPFATASIARRSQAAAENPGRVSPPTTGAATARTRQEEAR